MVDKVTRINGETLAGQKGIKYISADYSMKAGDYNLIVDSSSAAVDVTLPSMSEAVGGYYAIKAPSGASNDVSVIIKETATEHTDGDMDADGDHAIYYCDGLEWITVHDGVA